MNRQRYAMVVGLVLVVLIGGWQGWIFLKKEREPAADIVKEPFAHLTIPEKYASDPAMKRIIEDKIERAKNLYAAKPTVWETWIAIGNIHALVEDFGGAIAAYRQSVALQPNNILGYRNIAEIYNQHIHDYGKAEEYYKLAIENQFSDPELYMALAFVQYKHLDKRDEAEKTYREGLDRTQNDSQLLSSLIQFYKNTGKTEQYLENVKLLLSAYPDNQFYRDTYGKELAAMGLKL